MSSSESAGQRGQAVVDWALAASTGAFLVRGGPLISPADAESASTELRLLTVEAERHVRELTGLGNGLPILPGEVVDRPGWIRSAANGLSILTKDAAAREEPGRLAPVLARSAGVQTGLLLAYMAARVLGQYDPFGGPGEQGQLLIVAPNVVAARRAMDVPAHDFSLWVCLHECTHRLQFTAVDWLRDYFAAEVKALVGGLTGKESVSLGDLVGRFPSVFKRGQQADNADSADRPAFLDLLRPDQRAPIDRLLALSTLLEGHADYVMDAVGPEVVPAVHTIRRRVNARRTGGSLLDRLLRKILGLDAKVRQYAQGGAFTRTVVQEVGMAGFNAIWTSPKTLPSRAEIADPSAWIRRVHG